MQHINLLFPNLQPLDYLCELITKYHYCLEQCVNSNDMMLLKSRK